MKRRFTILTAALALLTFLAVPLGMRGQTRDIKTETFENQEASTTYNSTKTYNANSSVCGIGWYMYYGTVSTNNAISESKSAQMRWYSSATSNIPYIKTTTAVDGLSGVAFNAKVGNDNVKMDVSYSTNGSSWESIATNVTVSSTNAENFSYSIPAGGKYIKIGVSSSSTAPSSGNYAFIVDDVVFTYIYTVTYNCAGGTSGCPTENPTGLSSGDHITLASAPTRTGHTFGGWHDGTTTYDAGADYTVTGNVTMTAQWTANTHNVTVTGASHGTVSGFTNPVAYNTVVTLTYTHNDGEYYGATFSSSDVEIYGSDNNKFLMPDHDVTITVTETPLPVYTVTYFDDGSSVTEEYYGAGVTLATRSGDDTYSFAGWTTSNIATETTDAPTIIPTNVTYHPTENTTLYPVYTRSEGSGTTWSKINSTNYSTIEAGTYALITPDGHAFNGSISSGHGQVTTDAFSFDSNNEATSAPSGTCELTLTAVTDANQTILGYTMYNSTNKYLYAAAASVGNLAWHDTEDNYWKCYSTYNWVYNSNTAYLRTYNNSTFRTYDKASNSAFYFVKKITNSVTYYISILSSIAVPSFDPESQNFSTASLTVTITANEGCAISYTTDGTDPESSSSATMTETNSATITVTTTTTIRALAFDGNDFSAEASQTYTRVYEVTLNSNGVAADPVEVVTGESTTLATPSNVPFGYSFRGWTATPATPTTLVSNTYTPNSNVTLYAVFGKNVYGNFEKVTLSQDDYSGYYLIVYNNTYALDSHYGNANTNTYGTYTDISGYYSLVNNTTHTIAYNETTAGLIVVAAKTTNGYSLYDTDGYLGDESSSTGAYLRWDSPFKAKQDEWTLGVNSIVNVKNTSNAIRWNNNSDSYRFAIYGTTGQQAIMLYKLKVNSLEGHYLQAYPTNTTATANITIEGPTVIESGAVLDMGGFTLTCDNPANLIIKDGGQLITGVWVNATVKKNITAYTSADDGWNLISSPVNTDLTAAGIGLTTETTYDLYYLNEGTSTWINFKEHEGNMNPGFSIQPSKGYLYSNAANTTLSFSGSLQPYIEAGYEVNLTKDGEGWNLVGNPFPFNAYVNKSYYVINGRTVEVYEGTDPVSTCTGIIVKATSANEKVTFRRTAFTDGAVNNGNLQMTLSQQVTTRGNAGSATIDNAIVSFNEGSQLEKFYFGEQNANIYIPQGNEEYAIISAEAQGEMPVSFHANENGQYTLTVNAENVEMNYLHLIDNMTGADIDLLQTPSYTFNAKTYDYESRFRLVFAANNEDGSSTGSETFSFYSNGNWVINNEGDATLQVIDALGRILSNESISGTVSKSIDAPAGVYVLRLINGENVKTQKIVVR